MEGLAAVPHGPYVLAGCLLVEIHLDGAALPHLDPYGLGQSGVVTRAHTHQDQIRVQFTVARGHFQPGALPLLDGQGLCFRHELDLVFPELFHDHLGEFGIPPVGRPRQDVDDLYFDADIAQGLAHLHSDVAPADQDGFLDTPLVQEGLELQGMHQVPDHVDAFQVLARDVQADGVGPRGHDEIIVGDALAAGQVDQPFLCVDALDVGPDSCVDTRLLELFGRTDDQPLGFLDYITDVIGHRSGGVGDEITPFDYCGFQGLVTPSCLGGARRSPRPAAYDNQLLAHE